MVKIKSFDKNYFFNEINITVYLFINYEFKEEEEQEDELKKKTIGKILQQKCRSGEIRSPVLSFVGRRPNRCAMTTGTSASRNLSIKENVSKTR